ncbi:MAG: N-acetyl-gamma-glutamyl-phosphate reductase [Saprospiraceae bacterium]|nr:N-acetyl-gamma-glutamyl-phosphate reductase [Saprospiraceae bacterium]
MIKAAIIGATGYTGSELVRLLLIHPDVELTLITSESRAGHHFSEVHPQYSNICDMTLHSADEIDQFEIDVAFLALPHRISMDYVSKWQDRDFKIVDLSGDYRLNDAETYEKWYSKQHVTPELVPDVPYGLPELERNKIKDARIVANPGCYPTASALALAPLFSRNIVKENIAIVDAKSGTTGAGVKSKPITHFSNVNDNFKAYGLKTHRHTVEIEESLVKQAGDPVSIQFTPHLLPIDRGILSTCYITPEKSITDKDLSDLYQEFYSNEPFIRLPKTLPEVKFVRGTNLCDIYATYDSRTHRIIVLSAIDNLMKGAAGQAVQNMNIMFDLEETSGLKISPLQP